MDDRSLQPMPPTPELVPAHAPAMRCETCGYNLPAPANFCGHCGCDMYPEHSPLLADVIDRYILEILPGKAKSTAFTQKLMLDILKREIGQVPIRKLTAPMIADMRDLLLRGFTNKGTQRSGPTVKRYLSTLRHLLRIAMNEWDLISSNPCAKVEMPKEHPGRIRFLSDEERLRLLDECRYSSSKTLFPLVVTAISTGARKGELLSLEWTDVDTVDGLLSFRTTKNGHPRIAPVTGFALDLLRDMQAKEGRVFMQNPRESFRLAMKRANIENFRFHDLRHTCASYLARQGSTLLQIGKILGHRTPLMAARYVHLDIDDSEQALGAMTADIFGPATKGRKEAARDLRSL